MDSKGVCLYFSKILLRLFKNKSCECHVISALLTNLSVSNLTLTLALWSRLPLYCIRLILFKVFSYIRLIPDNKQLSEASSFKPGYVNIHNPN